MAEQPSATLHHAKVADVLGLVVQHCPDFCKMQGICQLLLVSSTVRQQLLRAHGHGKLHYVTSSAGDDWVKWTSKPAGFTQWLPRHASLVDSISLEDCEDAPDIMQLALQMCTQVLRLCRITTAAAAAGVVGAAAHGSAAAGEPALQPLRLGSVHLVLTTDSVECVLELIPRALLQELAAAETQKLSVNHGAFGATAVLQLWTSLQELECEYMECSAVQLLPPSLQVLKAAFFRDSSSGNQGVSNSGGSTDPCCLDLQHLTQLRELKCDDLEEEFWADDVCSLKVKLPAQLTRLCMYAKLHEITGGSSLQTVILLWRSLAGLHSLESIAGPWKLLLMTGYCPDEAQPPVAAAAAATLSKATGLTSLFVRAMCPDSDTPCAFGSGQLCAVLLSLPRLQRLRLQDLDMSCEDLLALTALTQLRSLRMEQVPGCDDAIAAALAHSLTGLTCLVLRSRSMKSQGAGLLAVCGKLTDLCRLTVGGAPEFCVGDKELLLLSGLTQLTYLALPPRCSRAGKERFLAGMPRLTRVDSAGS